MFSIPIYVSVLLLTTTFNTIGATPIRELNVVTRETGVVPASPHWIAYSDEDARFPSPAELEGYNVFILSFLLTDGAQDVAAAWEQLSKSQRSSIRKNYHKAGISLMVSAFGATDAPTSNGADPVQTANTMAHWVKKYGVDGIDVDYEDFSAVDAGTSTDWVTTFVSTLRNQLPSGQYIITGAPIAPWFTSWYASVDESVGSMIDWYNVQFYSQGREYTSCNGILNKSGGQFPRSSLFEIAHAGFPLNKLVIGKPGTQQDASGYVPPEVLAGCVADAKKKGWHAGVMVWEWPDAPSSWIRTVRSQSYPVSASEMDDSDFSSVAMKPNVTSVLTTFTA